MDFKEMKKQILDCVGGQENVRNVTHCATRLRLDLADDKLFNEERLKKIDGVINTLRMGGQCQIIIGPNVKDLYHEFMQDAPAGGYTAAKKSLRPLEWLQAGFSFLGACVGVYIIPLIGGGLIKALLTVLVQLGLITASSDTYTVLWFAADAVFQFLPVFVAIGAARKLRANEIMAVYLAAIMLSPTYVAAVNGGTPLSIFGFQIPLISYYNGFLPAIATVVVMAWLERGLKKIIPAAAQQLLIPFLLVFIMTPVAFLITGPLAQEIGNLLAQPLILLSNYSWIVVTILGLIMPILIMFGLHAAIFTFCLTVLVATFGYDPLFMPASLCSHCAMGAVALAVFLKSKKASTRTTAISSCATVWLGSVSEPVIFGVLAQNRASMLSACLAGGVSALFGGIFGLKCYALVGSGLIHIPTFVGEQSSLWIPLACAAISIVVGMALVFVFYQDKTEE